MVLHARPRRSRISAARPHVQLLAGQHRPSSSLDLNPLDFSVWSVLERTPIRSLIQNLKALQQAIHEHGTT
ncbi:Hypothetical protein FKW44_003966 [Caligus rogercresseyi]|uniref:Uncharacterized protein n=1 Tax=Caligus rogercresseyi TaxID=217165 RepID=A0A7T8KB89_CALRO|nr:Hypothetical protein FKW44_003966 [Caligus rogercresseyi]